MQNFKTDCSLWRVANRSGVVQAHSYRGSWGSEDPIQRQKLLILLSASLVFTVFSFLLRTSEGYFL